MHFMIFIFQGINPYIYLNSLFLIPAAEATVNVLTASNNDVKLEP